MTASSPLDRLREVFCWSRGEVSSRLSEWFYTYHADLYVHDVPFEIYVRKAEAIRRALGEARCVLDVGAGFGVYACLLRVLGVSHVVALDYHAEKARTARRLAEYLQLDGLSILQGDVLSFPFPAGSFDGALTLASLSHIREPELAIRSLATLLRPGGRLYVFEDNNSSHPGYAKNMSPIWEGAETGRYADGVPSEKKIPESYLDLRRGMIRGRFPDLSPESVERCARDTRGLHGRRIFEAVEVHRAGREIVNPRRPLACHPVSGEFEEYPLNPALVKQMLRDAGFDAQLKSPHTGPFRGPFRILKGVAAGILSLCPALLPWTSPTFSVVAERRSD